MQAVPFKRKVALDAIDLYEQEIFLIMVKALICCILASK